SAQQVAPGSIAWTAVNGGDGGIVAVDAQSIPGVSIHYTTGQNLSGFRRDFFLANGTPLGSVYLGLHVVDLAGAYLRAIDPTVQFISAYVLNAVDPHLMLVGTNFLYESSDFGDTLHAVGGPLNPVGAVSTLAYGGRSNGQDNPDVIWVGSDVGTGNKSVG